MIPRMTGDPAPAPRKRLPALLRLYLGLTALAPAVLTRMARKAHAAQGAAPERLAERFGQATAPRPDGVLIWVNAASVGEVASALDLATDLARETGGRLLITTTTATGGETVARRLPQAIHQFQPVDTPAAVRGFLDHWRPDLACFIENDLWPRLMIEADRRGIPMAVLNARASRSRARAPRSVAALLGRAALISTQHGATARQSAGLGLAPAKVLATCDLKSAASPLPANPADLARMQAEIGVRPVWVAASTHPGDEAQVIAAHKIALEHHPDLLLILIPRHPARGDEVARLLDAAALPLARRSAGGGLEAQTQVYLADTLGETGLFYRLAPLVFLGGSFGAEGGHNPYEPAQLGTAVLHGPRVANFAGAYAGLTATGAALSVADGVALGEAVARLTGSTALDRMRAAAAELAQDREAVRRDLLERLIPLMPPRRSDTT